MATATPTKASDRKLVLKEVLDWLVEDGLIDGASAARVVQEARAAGRPGLRHPVIVIGEARLRSAKAPGAALTPQSISEWLGARLKLPFYHIDPLKIDLKSVTAVMSSDYAKQRGILPVEVSGKDVTIAVSEPFMTSWESELASMLRLNIKRVLSNPIDIERR